MKQFSLPLQKRTQRPVARIETFCNIDAMLDTGSVFPIWVEDEGILEDLGGKPILNRVEFGGFGGTTEGKLYELPQIQIGDLIYPNFHIISSRIKLPCSMLISATMFKNLIYEVDDYNHSLNITIPDRESNVRDLSIWDENGKLHVYCQSAE